MSCHRGHRDRATWDVRVRADLVVPVVTVHGPVPLPVEHPAAGSARARAAIGVSRLHGEVAIVTGAARGLGAAIAALFAEHGATVVLVDRHADPLRDAVADMQARGMPVAAYPMDVREESQWRELVAHTTATVGDPTVLVNNAAITARSNIETTQAADWDAVMAVNARGVWLGMKHVAPRMRIAGHGSIVNVSSVYGIVGSGSRAAYHASKAAVRALTRTAAIEFVADCIRVNCLVPGILDSVLGEPSDAPRGTAPTGEAADVVPDSTASVAFGALFLASPESNFMTGADLIIDGGFSCSSVT